MKNGIAVYSEGICYASVCSALSVEEVAAELNAQRPTGIRSGWQLSTESFASGESNPCECNIFPNVRKHYLFVC